MQNLTSDLNCTLINPSDNSSNASEVCDVLNAEPSTMTLTEILTIVITTALGLTGIFLNIGILTIIVQKKLIKKDYRMLYYMFMTCGDLLFAINCTLVGINIAFKSIYVFKITGVCLTVMIVFGLVAYEWTAICIILLLIDLVWTLKHPFSGNRKLKRCCKFGCVGTFFIGVFLAVGPFWFWDDIPYELSFCSIANVYGNHAEFFMIEAVVVCVVLLAVMVSVSAILLYQIYSTHAVDYETRQKPSTVNDADIFIIEPGTNKPNPNGVEQNKCHVNNAYDHDEPDASSKHTPQDTYDGDYKHYRNTANDSRQEVRRREFLRSCRTIGCFMAAYIGCITPYIILNGLSIGCGSNCADSPETRVIRAMVATALYLLPVIDPILYTKRFDVFKKAAVSFLGQCCKTRENADTTIVTF